jgi:hypothetical protein
MVLDLNDSEEMLSLLLLMKPNAGMKRQVKRERKGRIRKPH